METLRRFLGRRAPAGGAAAYARHRDPAAPPRDTHGDEDEDEDEDGGTLRLRPGGARPRPRPRPRLRPLLTLLLGAAAAFLAGLLAGAGSRGPCGGGAGAGLVLDGPAPEEEGGVAAPEAPPPWPRLREQLLRHLQGERVDAWVQRWGGGGGGRGPAGGAALARAVLGALGAAGLRPAWSQRLRLHLPRPPRGRPSSLHWVDGAGRELERLHLDPAAFCPWGAPGVVTGPLLYGHHGRPRDLAALRRRGEPLRGGLLLLRLGPRGGRPAQQVAVAQAGGAAGVLFYPDPRDAADAGLGPDTAVSVHVQPGAGDPYSRGFPAFGARPPPRRPPWLPRIPAQPLGARTAARLLRALGAPGRLGPGGERPRLRLRVALEDAPVAITNVFAALEGRLEPERWVVVGAQRDALGPGAAGAAVGTALLLELARAFAAMVRDGLQLRRTLLFVSWDGGAYGHVGAMEWLEGFPGLLPQKVVAYISLDRAVLGDDRFVAKTSPTLVSLIESVLRQVDSPNESGRSLLEQVTRPGRPWESDVIRPLTPESGAYPFTAAAGIPAVELCFTEAGGGYAALGSPGDTAGRLRGRLRGRLPAVAGAVAAVAGLLLLRLGHEPLLPLEPAAYGTALLRALAPLARQPQAQGLPLQWLYSARGDLARAAAGLRRDITGSEANERLQRRFNTRIMAVEAALLSPFVSPLAAPFRHVLLGRGGHTVAALGGALGRPGGGGPHPRPRPRPPLRLRLALLARTLQRAARALAGDAGAPGAPPGPDPDEEEEQEEEEEEEEGGDDGGGGGSPPNCTATRPGDAWARDGYGDAWAREDYEDYGDGEDAWDGDAWAPEDAWAPGDAWDGDAWAPEDAWAPGNDTDGSNPGDAWAPEDAWDGDPGDAWAPQDLNTTLGPL